MKQSNNETIIFTILSTLLLAYLWIRAYSVPITFDEAATFFHFVHRGDFWFFNSLPDANNHFINSLLTYISYHSFGSSKLALRLPNLLSAIIFLYFLFRISLFIRSMSIRWIFILSIMFTHYFIEFFALSRGYGLSMAFLFGVLYHLMKFTTEKSIKQVLYISMFLVLANFSNLSLLVLSTAIIGYQIALLFLTNNNSIKTKLFLFVIIILLEILPLVFAVYYMLYLKDLGSLYYGANSGFWSLTVVSLILLATGTKVAIFKVGVIIFAVYLIVALTFLIWKNKLQALSRPLLIIPILLFATIIGIVILTEIFGVNYPEDRVAIYLIPLFFGSIVMVSDSLISSIGKNYIMIVTLPLLFLPIHFFDSINLQYVNGYKTEVVPERFYETVVNNTNNHDEFPPTIGGYRMRMFCWTYMNFRNGGTQNLVDYQGYPDVLSDYQIVDADEHPEWLNYYDVIDTEDVLGRQLLKRKRESDYELVRSNKIDSTIEISQNEYYNLAEWNTDTLTGQALLINIELNIHSPEVPFHAWVVMHVIDDNKKNIEYKNIPFDWLRTKWGKGDNRFKHSFLTSELPANSSLLKIYIWNIDKGIYTIEDAKIDLFKIVPPTIHPAI
ncbi:MAG: hypothetical protein H8E34_13260 [Bacteroidetes bacterium]|nr:hypothetical protein [Bacteroidota bacterium]MBL6943340.1 hypothetical protein [Bacteroidales bacterium]